MKHKTGMTVNDKLQTPCPENRSKVSKLKNGERRIQAACFPHAEFCSNRKLVETELSTTELNTHLFLRQYAYSNFTSMHS